MQMREGMESKVDMMKNCSQPKQLATNPDEEDIKVLLKPEMDMSIA